MGLKMIQLAMVAMMATTVLSNVPFSYTRFSASFLQTVNIQMGDMPLEERQQGLRTIVDATGLPKSVLGLAKVDRDAEGALMEFDMSASGTATVDFTNNILLQTVGLLTFVDKMFGNTILNLSIPVSETNLIYYDLNKNFTWNQAGCTCNPIQGTTQMFVPFVPPFANFAKKTTILVNGVNTSVEEWTASIPYGFNFPLAPGNVSLFDMSWTFYLRTNTPQLAKVLYSFNIPGFSVSTAISLWDVTPTTSNKAVLPDNSCANLCKAEVEIASHFPTCAQGSGVCQCLSQVNQTFCGAVNWLVSNTIFANSTDQYVAMVYQEILKEMNAVGVVPPQCQLELKQFLCQFYFPLCGSSNTANFVKPPLSIFTCNISKARDSNSNAAVMDAAYQTAPFSAYMAAEGKTQSYNPPAQNNGSSGLEGWQIALIVIGSVVGGVMLVAVVAIYMKKRRGNYSAL